MTSPSASHQMSEWEGTEDKRDPGCQAINGFFCMLGWRRRRRVVGGKITKDGWKMRGWCNNQRECQTLYKKRDWENKTQCTPRLNSALWEVVEEENTLKISWKLYFSKSYCIFLPSQCSTVPAVKLGDMLMSSHVVSWCRRKLDFGSHGGNDLVTSGHGWCNFTAVLLMFPLERVLECVRLCIYPHPLRAWDLKHVAGRCVIKEIIYFFLRISSFSRLLSSPLLTT